MRGNLNRPWGRGARWYLDVEQKPLRPARGVHSVDALLVGLEARAGGPRAAEGTHEAGTQPEVPARPPIRPEEHVKLARFALRGLGIRADEEDELGFALVDLVEAARRWNDGNFECSWATFALHRIKWAWILRNFIKGKPRRVPEVPLFLQGKDEDDEIERAEMTVEDPGLEQAAARVDVERLLGGLGEREAHVLRARFGIGRDDRATFGAIEAELGLSGGEARQVERRALAKLRKRARVAAPVDPLEALWTRIEG